MGKDQKNRIDATQSQGFTLIEIVMILVLLGILAAVATSKYFDMHEEAMQKSAWAAVAEAQSRMNAVFGEELLLGKSCAKAREESSRLERFTEVSNPGEIGEFVLAQTGDWSGDTGPLTITDKNGQAISINASLVLPECGVSGTVSLTAGTGNLNDFLAGTQLKGTLSDDWGWKVSDTVTLNSKNGKIASYTGDANNSAIFDQILKIVGTENMSTNPSDSSWRITTGINENSDDNKRTANANLIISPGINWTEYWNQKCTNVGECKVPALWIKQDGTGKSEYYAILATLVKDTDNNVTVHAADYVGDTNNSSVLGNPTSNNNKTPTFIQANGDKSTGTWWTEGNYIRLANNASDSAKENAVTNTMAKYQAYIDKVNNDNDTTNNITLKNQPSKQSQ